MKVTVNGQTAFFDAAETKISDVLKKFKVAKPEMVSVQLNEKYVEQRLFESTTVSENDEIEFIYFMGGGQVLHK